MNRLINNRIKYILIISTVTIIIYSCTSPSSISNFRRDISLPLKIENNGKYQHKSIIYDNISDDSLGLVFGNSYEANYFGNSINQLAEIDKTGMKNGVYIEFHEEGTIYNIGSMTDGKLDGSFKTYSKSGVLLKYSFLINGKQKEKLVNENRDSILSIERGTASCKGHHAMRK